MRAENAHHLRDALACIINRHFPYTRPIWASWVDDNLGSACRARSTAPPPRRKLRNPRYAPRSRARSSPKKGSQREDRVELFELGAPQVHSLAARLTWSRQAVKFQHSSTSIVGT